MEMSSLIEHTSRISVAPLVFVGVLHSNIFTCNKLITSEEIFTLWMTERSSIKSSTYVVVSERMIIIHLAAMIRGGKKGPFFSLEGEKKDSKRWENPAR